MDKEEIMKDHPSICYNCAFARKAGSDENQNKGYVGCAKYLYLSGQTPPEFPFYIGEAKELAEGWVDLKRRPFQEKSGILTNLQLLTIGVNKCASYEEYSSE